MTTQHWEKCLTKSKQVVQIFVAVGHFSDSGTTTDKTVGILAEEKGFDLMLWGRVFFSVSFCYCAFSSTFYYIFVFTIA